MANYKVVDADQLDAAMSATADSIRAKTGGTDPIVWDLDNGFQAAVDGIQTGGGTGDIPLAATTEFGREKISEPYQAPTGKSYFNGVLLPDIPADVLAQYPYAWIRKHTTNGEYQAIFSASGFFYNGNGALADKESIKNPKYVLPLTDGTAWTVASDSSGYSAWTVDDARPCMWSNHDIPNGSATATDVYFEGTEAVQQLETKINYDYGDYAANAENYAVANEVINEIAHRMQKRYSTYDLFTGAEVRDFIERCDFFEKGNVETVLEIGDFLFENSAVGTITG